MDSEAKINALRDHILEQCREQDVTIDEFDSLMRKLSFAVRRRKIEAMDTLLIPRDKPISRYYHVF